MLQVLLALTWYLLLPVAAQAAAGNPKMAEMSMREMILERDRALQGFAGQAIPEVSGDLGRTEEIASGTVFFYGEVPVKVGLRDIDWSGGHLKHQEWPAQLNRFGYLRQLASAYRATHDERFATAARAYIEDWIRSNPGYDRFRPSDSSLNMSIRLGTSVASGWAGVLPVFLDSPAFDDEFLKTMMVSISSQARFLSRHLTPRANWRISELDALVFTALRLPFLENAQELLDIGVEGLRNAFATQFLPDGVHVERTPSYHDWMANVAANYYDLAKRFPEADAHVDPALLVGAFDYSAQSDLFGVNDSGSRHRDPEILRGAEHRREVLRRLLSDQVIGDYPPLEQVFPDAGQVFARSAWQPGADYLAFDAGTWGGGHCHLNRLSFVFRSKGRELIADPGILNYEMSDPLGPYGKSTPAHSTLNLNGWNQSEADAQLLRTEFTAETALIHASYQGGYWPGSYGWSFERGHGKGVFGSHERVLFWVKGEYLLALDTMEADGEATVHNCWQMGPMEGWSKEEETLSWWSRNEGVNLFLQLIPFEGKAEMECFEGSREPLRGWVGSHGHDAIPAPLVEFRYPSGGGGGSTSAVLLAPFQGTEKPSFAIKRASSTGWGQVHHLELRLPDGSTDSISWTNGLSLPVDDGDPVVTDAPFAWLHLNAAGEPVKCFLLDGSYLEYNGRSLLRGSKREAKLFVLTR